MTSGVISKRDESVGEDDSSPSTLRGWEFEAIMTNCADLFEERREIVKRMTSA